MARYGRLLTDAQWEKIRPLLPKRPRRPKGGRPRKDDRNVLEGILWVLRSGARWCDLPEEFPSPATCWRRLRDWEEQEVWLEIWRAFLSELNERQQLKWSESFLDGSFAPAKKGATESEKPSGARGRSGWWWSTARVFLWETTFTLHPRRKSNSRRRRSPRSAYDGGIAREDRDKNPRA
jgi:transposase